MDRELDQVRKIILGIEFEERFAELRSLKNDIRDEDQFQILVSKVISEALSTRASQDESIAAVLMPTIENAISGSINQDPKKMAESLYPIMGPAIRKSITETLNQMMENFNQMIEQSLSPKSLRWRFDAWRTGRSYSEIVLLNSLEYQVEQIFLIHRETSLLITNVVSELAESKDADMVSSMFSAIQDFIEDSFATSEEDALDTLRIGELIVVIVRGPLALAAAVIRGREPEFLRVSLTEVLETLHQEKYIALKDYDGDTSNFDDVSSKLSPLLKSQSSPEEKRKVPWLAVGAITIILLGFAVISYFDYERSKMIEQFHQDIAAEPGIIVLEISEIKDVIQLKLLADRDAKAISDFISEEYQNHFSFAFESTPYFSAEQSIVLRRANRVLSPEVETHLSYSNGILSVSGRATDEWIGNANKLWKLIIGVESLDLEALTIHSPARKKINEITHNIESFIIEFEKEQNTVDRETTDLKELTHQINELVSLTNSDSNSSVQLYLVGFTDVSGGSILNRKLGLARANSLRLELIASGLDPKLLTSFSHLDLEDYQAIAKREVRVIVKVVSEND